MADNIKYDITIMVVFAIIGIFIKLFFGKTITTDGSQGPASATMWGYGIVAMSILSIIFITFALASRMVKLEEGPLKFIKQLHTNRVEIINKSNLNQTIYADGSIAQDNKIALAIMTADCAPIFIFNSNFSFVCALHAGWKGCLKNIVKNAKTKINQLHNNNQTLTAIVGPCLNKENFEVDINFKNIFVNQDLQYENFFSNKFNRTKPHFDMRGLINFQLQNCCIKNIVNIEFDTYKNENLFYSHRKSLHNNTLPTGRMINLIGLKQTT